MLDVTVLLSELSDVEKVRSYYTGSTSFIREVEQRQEVVEQKLKGIDEAGKDIPSLL